MIILFLAVSLVMLLYGMLIISFHKGWKRIPEYTAHPPSGQTRISVVITVRNEENHLPALLECLERQSLHHDLFKVVIVDDHSEDRTWELAESFSREKTWVQVLRLERYQGKKYAVRKGVEHSSNDLVVTIDGDCLPGRDWLMTLLSFWEDYRPALICGPVIFPNSHNIAGQWVDMEFVSLVTAGAGAVGYGAPVMCNAANMAFPRHIYSSYASLLNTRIASGDDVFFMLHLKKTPENRILFLKSQAAVVQTEPPRCFRDFIHQRMRWTSKSLHYRDKDVIITGSVVWSTNLLLLLILLLSLINSKYILIFLLLFLIKCIIDFILLNNSLIYFNKKNLRKLLPLFQFVYIFYITIMPVLSFPGRFRWKGRNN